MAIRIIKEVSRDGGRLPATGATIIAGQPIELVTASTVRPFTDVSGTYPLGLASDSNVLQPLAGPGGLTVGVGFDYTNFNRGGLIGAFLNGGVFELYDDSTGLPFLPGDVYVLNGPVYANSSGLVTSTSTSNVLIGTVMQVTGSPVTRLQIKLTQI